MKCRRLAQAPWVSVPGWSPGATAGKNSPGDARGLPRWRTSITKCCWQRLIAGTRVTMVAASGRRRGGHRGEKDWHGNLGILYLVLGGGYLRFLRFVLLIAYIWYPNWKSKINNTCIHAYTHTDIWSHPRKLRFVWPWVWPGHELAKLPSWFQCPAGQRATILGRGWPAL